VNLGINDIKEITAAMAVYPNMDYSGYAFSFLKRRLTLIFAKAGVRRVEHFILSLESESFRDAVIEHMCVEVTEMFRDPAFWRLLRDKIVPLIPEGSKTIWIPFEPSGEEAFSLSIVLHESFKSDDYQIVCDNPSGKKCKGISEGLINLRHQDINLTNYRRLEHKDKYIEYIGQMNGHMILTENMRSQINCRNSYFLSDNSVPDSVGLILFRNVAIYYNHKTTETAFQKLIDTLVPGGFLVIGVKEVLPKHIEEELILIDEAEKIYQKPKQNSFYA
jgi:chemotaxis protein methyltransferase CheR